MPSPHTWSGHLLSTCLPTAGAARVPRRGLHSEVRFLPCKPHLRTGSPCPGRLSGAGSSATSSRGVCINRVESPTRQLSLLSHPQPQGSVDTYFILWVQHSITVFILLLNCCSFGRGIPLTPSAMGDLTFPDFLAPRDAPGWSCTFPGLALGSACPREPGCPSLVK